jgi:DNA-binding NarL/FixJ family response regulator
VLIVEPAEVVRAGLRRLLEEAPDLVIAGEAKTTDEAVRRAEEVSPAVAIVGLDPLQPENLECIRRIAAGPGRTAVIVVRDTTSVDPVVAALRAGARGYLTRDVQGEFLLQAITVVKRGGTIIDSALAEGLVGWLASRSDLSVGTAGEAGPTPPFETLSERETQVLRLLGEGMSNTEIASALGLRVGTVKTHIHHIYRKLRVSDRTSAALAAVRLASPPSPAA